MPVAIPTPEDIKALHPELTPIGTNKQRAQYLKVIKKNLTATLLKNFFGCTFHVKITPEVHYMYAVVNFKIFDQSLALNTAGAKLSVPDILEILRLSQ